MADRAEIRRLRDELVVLMGGGHLEQAAELIRELERVDEDQRARWSQRLGDLYRRMGRLAEADVAYARAQAGYAHAGFERQASAMAQTRRSTWPPPSNAA